MEDAEGIDAVLNRPWYVMGLGPWLEPGYEAETGATRRKLVATYVAILLFLTLVCIPLDLQGHVLRDGLTLRLGIETPVVLACLQVLRRRRPLWVEAIASALPVALVLCCTVVLGLRSPPPFIDRYLIAAGVLGFVSNIVIPMRLHHAAILSAINVTLYSGVSLLGLVAPAPPQAASLVCFFGAMMILTLRTAARRERAEKDRYLFTHRDKLQNRKLAQLNDELSRIAERDALTDIGNRRCFDRMFDLLWGDARLEAGRLALVMIDVDRFKSFNDAAGHAEGDRCLRAVARAIAGQVRPTIDVATRYGGEEFAVLIPIAAGDAAKGTGPEVLAERIRSAIEAQDIAHPGLGPDGKVTVSIGVAFATPGRDAHSPASLLEAADRALYAAKRDGRNRIRLAESQHLACAS